MAGTSIYDTTPLTKAEAKVLVKKFIKEIAPQTENLDVDKTTKAINKIIDDMLFLL